MSNKYPAALPYLPELQHLGSMSVLQLQAQPGLAEALHTVTPEQQTITQEQEAMIGTYFMEATQALPEQSSEQAVWDKIFDIQSQELLTVTNETEKDRIALNILVGNQLSQYGIYVADAAKLRTDRAWKMAQTREGARFNKVAEENIGLCVATGQPTKPYQSVAEQLGPIEPSKPSSALSELLKVTDKSYVGRTALHEDITISADEAQAGWLINLAVEAGDTLSVAYNVVDVQPAFRQKMVRELLAKGQKIHQTLLRPEPPFSEALPRSEVIEDALRQNPEALVTQNFSSELPEVRDRIITELIPKITAEDAGTWLKYHLENVGPEHVAAFSDKLGREMNMTALAKFSSLPPNALRLLSDNNSEDYSLASCIGKYDAEDQARILKEAELGNSVWSSAIYAAPEEFKLMDKDEILSHARKHDRLYYIASNIDQYTDGSDQELILELLNLDTNYARTIPDKISDMPLLDKAWLVETYKNKAFDKYFDRSLRILAGFVDPKQFLLDRLEAQDSFNISYVVQQIARRDGVEWGGSSEDGPGPEYGVPVDELYQILKDNQEYDAILGNVSWGRVFEKNKDNIVSELMASPGGPEALAKNISYLDKDEDLVPLYDHVVALKLDALLAYNYERFEKAGIPLTTLVGQLRTSTAGLDVLIKAYNEKTEIQQLCILDELLETAFTNGHVYALTSNLSLIPKELHQRVVDTAIANNDTTGIATHLDKLAVDGRDIARQLIAAGQSWDVFANPLNYYGKGFGGLSAQDLIEDGAGTLVIRWHDRFADYNEEQVIDGMVERGQYMEIFKNIARLEQPMSEATRLYIASQGGALIAKKFPAIFGAITPDIITAALDGDDPHFPEVYELATEKLPWLDTAIKLLGPDTPAKLLTAARFIAADSTEAFPQDLLDVGVKSHGQQGYEELRALPGMMRQRLLVQGDDAAALPGLVALLASNPYAASAARQTVRFNEAEWGNKSSQEWQKILTAHMAHRAEHAPLPEGFVASEPITISQIDAKEFDPSKIDEDARARYDVLRADIVSGLALSQRSGPNKYDDILAEGVTLLQRDLARLSTVRSKLVEQANEKALVNIDGQIGAIQTILGTEPAAFKKLMRSSFETVGNLKVKGLDSVVRSIAFGRAFTKSENAASLAQKISHSELSHDALGSVDNLVSYLVNDEVYGQFFTSDQSRKSFNKLSDTSALRAQLTKLQQGAATGKSTIQFIPSRGLLMELSGHIADACWASKYDSIAEAFPNISTLTFVRDQGTKNERLFGSCLLIDSVDLETNEPVLIVRGINPIENYINKVKVDEFTASLFDYVKSIAGDRKVATVFDKNPGRAATNRPVLHDYLMKDYVVSHKTGEALQLPEATTFNGYELSSSKGEPAFIIS